MLNQTQNARRTLISTAMATLAFLAAAHSGLAQDIWTGADVAHSTSWMDGTNWQAGTAPLPYDSLTFSGSAVANNNTFPNGTAFDGITFPSGAGTFNLTGNSILLSGNVLGTNNGILNNSTVHQAVGLNLGLDWGFYTLIDYSGTGLSLNGTLTPGSNGLAYFYGAGALTSTSLTTDSTGLISGLGGQGLMCNGAFPVSVAAPTGLATIIGGTIQAYTGYTTASPGANIPSGAANNIELTSSGTSGVYGASNLTVNTITSTQTGNGASLATDTINNTNTLTLGNNGGIYVLNTAASARGVFVLTGGNLTAGTVGTPATLVMATDGTSTTNQAQIASVIQDNGSGGPVTVVTAGNGVVNFTKANTYSGGTYITQGELLGTGFVSCLGVGPVYIAANATFVINVSGTWTNNFYLSPGLGDTTTGQILNSGALVWDNNTTLAGTINLLGAPATTGHGDRISGNDTSGSLILSGQITGTGTLEIGGAHSVTAITLANTNTNALNNWQGGLILNANTGVAVNTYFKMGANNQMPNGPNAGNVTLIPATSAVYARFDLNGWNTTINGLISTTGGTFANLAAFGTTNCTLTLGANNATASFAGSVTDSGNGKALNLIKIGTGMQTFTGALGYNGNTAVSNGTFELQNTMANSSNIIVAAAGTFDASQGPGGGFTVGVSQTLTGTGTVMGSTTVNGTLAAGLLAVNGATTNIGVLTNNGNVTFDGGATNIWSVSNAKPLAGPGVGWSFLNIISNGQLAISGASPSAPIHIKLVSLTASGSPGIANFNPNVNQSWTLVQSTSPIVGYTGLTQFVIDTSAFSNLPLGSSQFSVSTNLAGNSLVLYFTSTPVITSGLVNQTNNAGTTASFTVTATGGTPITYQWVEGGTTVLVNGGTSASGGGVSITTNGAGTSSTLMITNVQDPDNGAITVNVTNNTAGVGSSTATLSVIDPPSNPTVSQSGSVPTAAGGLTYLTVSANGTGPFTYIWSFNGVPLTNGVNISGANTASLGINVTPSAPGNYTVVVSNQAGSVMSSSFVIGPVTSVPSQLVYEPWTSYGLMSGPASTAPANTWIAVTNLYNQATGEPVHWFHSSGSGIQMVIEQNPFPGFTANGAPGYPWPGLAGNSSQAMILEVASHTDNDQLEFATNGFGPGQSVYFSFILECDDLGAGGASDCIAAFNVANEGGAGTSFNLKLSTQTQTDGSYWLGLSKGNGNTGASQGVDAYTLWATGFQPGQDVLVVGVYQINSGISTNTDDSVAMWLNPASSTFAAASAPTPTLGPSTFGVLNSSSIHTFVTHGVALPGNRNFSDLRIGTTWASVTPISGPNLTLSNQFIVPGANAVFASDNAGNPITTYKWYFDGTNGTPLTDGPNPTGDGSIITNSSTGTLTIIGATAADLGTYTVVGQNTDPVTSATLTASASATLNFISPPLNVTFQSPNVVLSWSTNFVGFKLEQTAALSPPSWSIVPTNSYVVSGTNYTVAVSPANLSRFYQLIGP